MSISNCGHDEKGKYSGGAAGDQTGTEYQVRSWYNRPWLCVLRHPDAKVRQTLATTAKNAAENNYIGYDQSQRITYYVELKAVKWKPENIKKKCEADCSSSTVANVIATGHQLGMEKLQNVNPNCTTANLRAALKAAGFEVLTDSKYLTSDNYKPVPTLASASPNLKKGNTGKQVGYLQKDLNYLGFKGKNGKSLTVDEDFGTNTEYAVRAFQKKHGLVVDGIYGSKSKAKMKSLLK